MLHLDTYFSLIHCSRCIVPKLGWNEMNRTDPILQGYGLMSVSWPVAPGCFALPGDVHCVLGLVPVQRLLSSCWLLRELLSSGLTQLHQILLQKKSWILGSLQAEMYTHGTSPNHGQFMLLLLSTMRKLIRCCAFFLPCTHWHLQMRWLQVWCFGEGETVQRATVVITGVSSGKNLD